MMLDFESPLDELKLKIEDLRRLSSEGNVDLSDEIARIESRAETLRQEVYANLTPNQIIQIARHQNRPDSLGLSMLIFDDFLELHGDRQFRDDPSIVWNPVAPCPAPCLPDLRYVKPGVVHRKICTKLLESGSQRQSLCA